ncbi:MULTISPECIES: signal peptidase I [unclassified Bradyrhizobium]|uniref:signal peptidase I n=1 Tax=unclassified Bradyrhizobium TaxID=2631580 RepID=UPI0024E0ED38|nr:MULTISPECIES: signal peptidase I [unclassified Bradyrhizobium]
MTSIEAGAVKPQGEPWWAITAIFAAGFVLLCLLLGSPLLIRTFLYQPFNIPAGSMQPTLLVGDYIFVSKYTYGWGRYTWPFSPPASGRIWGRDPERGDVVVFRLKDGKTDYIKRVVGLGGDRIQMKQGVLFINDTPMPRERLEDMVGRDVCGGGPTERVKRWRETLPNGVSYETLDCFDNGFFDNTGVYVVPAGHLFMLGDNRDNSTDSRVTTMGFIPVEDVIGRAAMIFMSIAEAKGGQPGKLRTERIGTVVR